MRGHHFSPSLEKKPQPLTPQSGSLQIPKSLIESRCPSFISSLWERESGGLSSPHPSQVLPLHCEVAGSRLGATLLLSSGLAAGGEEDREHDSGHGELWREGQWSG